MKSKYGRSPITDLIELSLLKTVTEHQPATTRQINEMYNESLAHTCNRLRGMAERGMITGTKKKGMWVWNLPEVNNDSN